MTESEKDFVCLVHSHYACPDCATEHREKDALIEKQKNYIEALEISTDHNADMCNTMKAEILRLRGLLERAEVSLMEWRLRFIESSGQPFYDAVYGDDILNDLKRELLGGGNG